MSEAQWKRLDTVVREAARMLRLSVRQVRCVDLRSGPRLHVVAAHRGRHRRRRGRVRLCHLALIHHRAQSDLIAMRHLASLLIAGWLLMVPPPKDGPDGTKVPDLDKPVSDWIQGRAYDSAEACEEMRAVGWNLEGATPERLAFTRGSRCVPAEHVYKPKPK